MRQVITPDLLELAKAMIEAEDPHVNPEYWYVIGKDEHHTALKHIVTDTGDIELDIKEDQRAMAQLLAICLARAISYVKGCTWMDFEPFLNLHTRYDRYCSGCYINLKPKNKVNELDNEILDEMQRIGRALDKVVSGGGDG